MFKKYFLIMILLSSTMAMADFKFGNLTYRGGGCPQGSVGIVPSPDNKILSLLFDDFRAEVPNRTNTNDNAQTLDPRTRRPRSSSDPKLSVKTCAISFTATLDQGEKVDFLEVNLNMRGATLLDKGVQGIFNVMLLGIQGIGTNHRTMQAVDRKQWINSPNQVEEDWISDATIRIPVSSQCATTGQKDIRFDLKNYLSAENTGPNQATAGLISVDSLDATGSVKFKVITSRCR